MLVLALISTLAASPPPPTTYIGGYWAGSNYTPIELTVADTVASLTMPFEGIIGLSSSQMQSTATTLHASFARGNAAFDLTVTTTGEHGRGAFKFGDNSYQLELRRIAPLSPETLASLIGSYQAADGRWIHITRRSGPFSGMVYVDESSGRLGAIFPTSDTAFFGGPGRLVPFPENMKIAFQRNARGEIAGLTMADGTNKTLRAAKVKVSTEEEVVVRNGSVTLSGTLYLPSRASPPLPAVVLVHGSDPNTRFTGALIGFFARQGFAVLTYDKRGNGKSTGSYAETTLDTLASDIAASVRYLAADKRIDGSRIGLWAISQGGWTAPLAIAQGAPVSFLILHAGATTTPVAQARDELENTLILRGATPEQRDASTRSQTAYFDGLRSAPSSATSANAKWFAQIMDYDPRPALRQLKIPLLAMFGSADVLVPPAHHVPPLLEELRNANNTQGTVIIFPDGSHRLEIVVPGLVNDIAVAGRYVPGYFQEMESWLTRTVVRKKN